MSTLPSEEVALDFQDVLDDLNINNRYEISNLTIIAKENIEHAQAISRTLEQHIRKVAPTRKLPALYVLDSIVKNVGSPYTIYLGRNLFSTFMDAYTLVDANTRRAMDSMLRTWKEPVPGSMEPTPVFPPDTTRVIENALNKAKAVLQKTQPISARPPSAQFRNTPTPPQHMARYGAPQQQAGQPPTQVAQSILAALSRPQQQDSTALLNADIENLIHKAKAEFAANVYDQSIQQRLKALLDLQTIMRTQQLPPDALNAIRAQVSALSATSRSTPLPSNPPQQWQPPNQGSVPPQPPTNLAQIFQRPPSTQPALPPSFAPGALDALLASTANGLKPSTPDLRQALPEMPGMPAPGINGNSLQPNGAEAQKLIDALKSAGLAASGGTPNPPPPVLPPMARPPQSAADLLKSLSAFPGLTNINTPPTSGFPPTQSFRPRIPLSQSGLKTFNPSLLSTLYSALPNQCPTCALRFPSTDAGKKAKAAHLDWHFRTNQRIADSVHRSLHRNWYPDEHAWLALKEVDVSVLDEEAAAAPAMARPMEKRAFVLAPGGVSKSCPICQDPFTAEWSDEAQEWVWWDAVEVGGRTYHANCLAEVTKGAAATTADASVLGKRKADEDPLAGLKAKLRTVA